MKNALLLTILALAITLSNCSGGKDITQSITNGDTAFETDNYQQALTSYEEVILYYESQDNSKECPVYQKAASAANSLGQTEKAIKYLEADRYTNFVNAETYYNLSLLYRKIDNISKEIDAMDEYLEKYPKAGNRELAQIRLFDIYMETTNWESATTAWELLSPESKASKTEDFFLLNKALKNDDVCDSLALQLLENDSENQLALDWMAKKLFWQAEKLYQSEMKAYSENKTNKQYNQLLRSLDAVTAEFKTSLGYFKKLYDANPTPEYAKYLGDIYNRLDDNTKANYYYEKSKGNN